MKNRTVTVSMSSGMARAVLVLSLAVCGGLALGQEQLLGGDSPAGVHARWSLDPGWVYDPAPPTLTGQGHSWARLRTGENWTDFRLRLRLALLSGGVHLNVRVSEQGRYLLGFREDGVSLSKESPWGRFRELAVWPQRVEPGQWHAVEISGEGGQITVSLDGKPILHANDEEPLLRGGIAFETLERSHARITAVTLESSVAEPEPGYAHEENPVWNMPDLAVSALRIEPERAEPGQSVTVVANVANLGTGTTVPGKLIVAVDGQTVQHSVVPPLGAAETIELRTRWRATEPGSHRVRGELEIPDTAFDLESRNDRAVAIARVAGDAQPAADIEASVTGWPSARTGAPDPTRLPLRIHNPGFADLREFEVEVRFDGERRLARTLDRLAPGESREIEVDLGRVEPGEHVLELELHPPGAQPPGRKADLRSWHLVMPAASQLLDVKLKHHWSSMGPRIIDNEFAGRLHKLAIHPKNPNILYVSTPRGGIWKTTTGGKSWTPLGDKLASLYGGAIALDPKDPDIVYYATGFSHDPSGVGLYKSLNGGKDWSLFADSTVMRGANALFVTYTPTQQVMVYAATHRGLLRYQSLTPKAKASAAAEWTVIKSGEIRDLAVNPKDPSVVYASVRLQGLWRTRKAMSANQDDSSWVQVNTGLPGTTGSLVVDIYQSDPKVLYAAYRPGCPACYLEVFTSKDEGASWGKLLKKPDNPARNNDTQFNPFIRVHPSKPVIYYGGGRLYKSELAQGQWTETEVHGAHVDLQELQFDPHRPDNYYQLNDGGIWRCQFSPGVNDVKTALNRDLRVTELYDLDVSRAQPALMIGGTQDNGTILTQGSLDWTSIRGGDGHYSLIALPDKIMYSQEQDLKSTRRAAKGPLTKNPDWTPKGGPTGLPAGYSMRNAWITVHPKDGDHLLSQGDQVYSSTDGGAKWAPEGPVPNAKGVKPGSTITRVVVQPKSHEWIAGNSRGQIWLRGNPKAPWTLLFQHPFEASVGHLAFAATNPDVLYAAFEATGDDAYTRLWRLEKGQTSGASWVIANITDNLPEIHLPGNEPVSIRVVAGDAFSDTVAHVGTARGVFRGSAACGNCAWNWKPYNEGLPLAIVNDLIVVPATGELRAATRGRGVWTTVTGP